MNGRNQLLQARNTTIAISYYSIHITSSLTSCKLLVSSGVLSKTDTIMASFASHPIRVQSSSYAYTATLVKMMISYVSFASEPSAPQIFTSILAMPSF